MLNSTNILAVIIWNMLSNGESYNPPIDYLFLDQKRKMKLVNRMKKKIAKFGIKAGDVGFSNQMTPSA